jgi:putative redox protein
VDAKVTWQKELSFVGVADSGYPILLDSDSSMERGAGPMELLALALASCTAMDVISILVKKRQAVTGFEVCFHGQRAREVPKRFVQAVLEYVVRGQALQEQAVVRAIELSVTKYCSVHANLHNEFPLEFRYSIYEGDRLTAQGTYQP